MKRDYQSGTQKRQAKGRKIAEAARNSQRLSLWLTRPETSKADEQDVSIRETESSPQLVNVNSFNSSTNEKNSDTTKGRSNASKNDNFPTIIVNSDSEIKKAIIAQVPLNNLKDLSLKILSKAVVYFQQIITIYVTQSGLKLRRYLL